MNNTITSNLSPITLLYNRPIVVRRNKETFIFKMPSIQFELDCVFDYNLFYGICISTLSALHNKIPELKFDSKLELIKAISRSGDESGVALLACLNTFIQDFEYVDDSFKCGNFVMDDEIFNFFCRCIALACGGISFGDAKQQADMEKMSEEERKWEERRLAMEQKLRESKSRAGNGTSLEKVVEAVCYEFKFSLQETLDMNKFGLYRLYEDVMKIASYDVSKIAAGTGNLGKHSKHNYWTNIK